MRKNETPARVVLTFARARFKSNEEPDDEILSFAFQISDNRATDLKTTASIPTVINQPMQSQSTYQPRSKGGAMARASG